MIVNKPADKLVFSEAQVQAHLSWAHGVSPLTATLEVIATDSVKAPRSLARPHTQTRLLGVYREHRELWLRQSTCKKIDDYSFLCVFLTIVIP